MMLKKIKRVDKIPSLPELIETVKKVQRVAVYARVSTNHEEQQTSLAAQKDYYSKLIDAHDDWVLAGIYADDGITGTSYLKREAFQQMVIDCEMGNIDRIITKSVSRFARNTVDALNTIRKLKSLGIGVYFEKENIWTLDSKGEFLITLMTSLAQEESRSISENVTWGHRKRFADGRYSCAYSRFLGYDKGYVINVEEAKTVKLIYKMFLQGLTPHTISAMLTEMGIPTAGGCDVWSQASVSSVLKNEKYKGDALLQKEFTIDFLSKKMKKNEGEINQYYVENGHEAIIAPWLFDYVQEVIKVRKDFISRYCGMNFYTSKFICGNCGAAYGLKPEHSNDKYRKDIWMCHNRFKKGVYCKNTRIDNAEIDLLTCRVEIAAIKKKRQVLDLCKVLLNECGVEDSDNMVDEFKDFSYSTIEDISIIINKICVLPNGRADVFMLDGTKHRLMVGTPIKETVQTEEKGSIKLICKHCRKSFLSYDKKRKYCSRECYIEHRFK